MEAIQFTEEQRRWAETSLQLGTIAKSLSGKQEEATNNNFIGESLIKNGYFDQTIPGSKSPILGNELVQNGNFEEKGSELVTNGNFSTNSDWTLNAGWDIDEINNRINRTAQSDSTSASQNISFVSGKSYIITYTLDVSAGSFLIRLGGDGVLDTPARSVDGTYTEVVTATGNHTIFNLRASDGAFAGSISNVSVKQLDPNDRWTVNSHWSLGDGYAEKLFTSSSSNYLQSESLSLTNGALYQIQFDLDIISTSTTAIGLSNTGAFGQLDPSDRTFTTSGTKTIESFYSSSKPNYFRFVGGANTNYKVTNISVKLIEAVDIDLWETITNSLDSTIVFSNGFVTLDYDGTDGGLAIKQSDILTVDDNYTVVIDYQMISGEAKVLLGGNSTDLTSTTRETKTFNSQATGYDDFSISRKTEGQAMKMVIYSVAVYKIDNSDWTLQGNWSIVRGQGLKGAGVSGDYAFQNSTPAVATKTYRIEYKISSYTAGGVRVRFGNTFTDIVSSAGTFVQSIVASNTAYLEIISQEVGGSKFDGVIEYIKVQRGEQSDTLDMTDPAPKALWIVAPGNLKVTTMSGTIEAFNNLEADTFIDWLRIKKVWLTGTTVSDIIGIY